MHFRAAGFRVRKPQNRLGKQQAGRAGQLRPTLEGATELPLTLVSGRRSSRGQVAWRVSSGDCPEGRSASSVLSATAAAPDRGRRTKGGKTPSSAALSAALTPGELGCSSGFRSPPGGSAGKELARIAGDLGSIPGLRRYPGEGNGYPLQYFGLENSMDRGAWRATVHGVAKWPLCGKQDEKGETLPALVSSDPD